MAPKEATARPWEGHVECTATLPSGVATKAQLFPMVGSARWRPGQLEEELARGSWALVSADAGTICDETLLALPPSGGLPRDDGRGAWEAMMRRVGRTSGQALRHGTPSDGQLAGWVRSWLNAPSPAG